MSLAEKVDKIHEQVIEQEGIKVVDLPKDIKAKIKGWNLLYAKLKKSEDETMFRSVQRKSVELADKIQDFIESDYEEESNSEEKKPEAKTEEKQTTKVTSNKSSFGNLVMEKKILTKIQENKNGRIRISELKSIIGKEPDYPEQKVNTITLRKIFMSSEYRVK